MYARPGVHCLWWLIPPACQVLIRSQQCVIAPQWPRGPQKNHAINWIFRHISSTNNPANTKHLHTICTTLSQRRSRWFGVVHMLYNFFVFAGNIPGPTVLSIFYFMSPSIIHSIFLCRLRLFLLTYPHIGYFFYVCVLTDPNMHCEFHTYICPFYPLSLAQHYINIEWAGSASASSSHLHLSSCLLYRQTQTSGLTVRPDQGKVPSQGHSGRIVDLMNENGSASTRKTQHCGEPPWPKGSVLGLMPQGFEFRILCISHHPQEVSRPNLACMCTKVA